MGYSVFFYLSKIGWALLAPANLVAVLLCVWLLAKGFEAFRLARFTLGCAAAIFLLCGFLPTGQNALYYLESQYKQPSAIPGKIDGILVLGGAVDTQGSIISGRPEFTDAVDRVLLAVELARYFPKAKLVFSGGSGNLVNNKRTDSIDMKIFLKNMGYEDFNVIYEDRSRNTYENIINSYSTVTPKKGETWILITSAFHMPRAMAVAEKLGWGLIPYPVDYRSDGGYVLLPSKFDTLDNLRSSQIALREMVGLAAYKLTGKN